MNDDIKHQYNYYLNKSLSIILFGDKTDADKLIDILSSMFSGIYRVGGRGIDDQINSIEKAIKKRKSVDTESEELILAFNDQYLSIQEKFNEINKQLSTLKGLSRKINKLESEFKDYKKSNIEKIKAKTKKVEKESSEKKLLNINNKCPKDDCNGDLMSRGKLAGYKRLKCNKCGDAFPIDNDKFFVCEECGKMLKGYGEVVKCLNCGAKKRIHGEPKKGKYFLKCPNVDCEHEWWYTGNRSLNQRITCGRCKNSFKLKKKHILKDNTGDEDVQNNP